MADTNFSPKKTRRTIDDENVDRISDLPLPIIHHILICLPIRDAVRTSILSRNWRYSWSCNPHVLFDWGHFPRHIGESLPEYQRRVMQTLDQVLLHHHGPIVSFQLSVNAENPVHIDRWIPFVARNGIQELIISKLPGGSFRLPSIIFSCKDITYLKLVWCMIPNPPPCFKGFQKIRSLVLANVTVTSDGMLQALVRGSSSLYRLELEDLRGCKALNIYSYTLVELSLKGKVIELSIEYAPCLSTLNLEFCMDTNSEADHMAAAKHGAAHLFPLRNHGAAHFYAAANNGPPHLFPPRNREALLYALANAQFHAAANNGAAYLFPPRNLGAAANNGAAHVYAAANNGAAQVYAAANNGAAHVYAAANNGAAHVYAAANNGAGHVVAAAINGAGHVVAAANNGAGHVVAAANNGAGHVVAASNRPVCKLFNYLGNLLLIKKLVLSQKTFEICSKWNVPENLIMAQLEHISATIDLNAKKEMSAALLLFRSSPVLSTLNIQAVSSEITGAETTPVAEGFWDAFRPAFRCLKFIRVSNVTDRSELMFLRFVLANAPVLEVMRLTLDCGDHNGTSVLKQIIQFKRISPEAQILIP